LGNVFLIGSEQGAEPLITGLLGYGYNVHCCVFSDEAAEAAAAYGAKAHVVDATDLDQLNSVSEDVIRYGDALDGMVLMPARGLFGSVEEIDIAQAKIVFANNVLLQIASIQCLAPIMRSNGRGGIILVRRRFQQRQRTMCAWNRVCDSALSEAFNILREEIRHSGVSSDTVFVDADSQWFDGARQLRDDAAGHSPYYHNQIEQQRRLLADASSDDDQFSDLVSRIDDALRSSGSGQKNRDLVQDTADNIIEMPDLATRANRAKVRDSLHEMLRWHK